MLSALTGWLWGSVGRHPQCFPVYPAFVSAGPPSIPASAPTRHRPEAVTIQTIRLKVFANPIGHPAQNR